MRITLANDRPLDPNGKYVLYWMVMSRRPRWNMALDRAVEHASKLGKPLIVLEALRCGYPWASDRFHSFVLHGMDDNRHAFAKTPIAYLPYVEPEAGAGKGLADTLAGEACVVVTDDYPCFMIPRMQAALAARIDCLMEAVDSNGLMPMRATPREFTTAYSFRRYLHKSLPPYLAQRPKPDPLARLDIPVASIPESVLQRWPAATDEQLAASSSALAALPIDHEVSPVSVRGGHRAGSAAIDAFVGEGLALYLEDRNHPQRDGTSGLSPYLHFGHVSSHQIFAALAERESWSPERLALKPTGKRAGWWGMSEAAEAFVDQLVTWRELGFNQCAVRSDYDQYSSLPEWARKTLADHEDDPREYVYSLEEFESASTHDPLWNAAQRQLVTEGRIHNYLRMLWGKKILHWTARPKDALEVMVTLNNKYALDGRDPNSYSGIFWVLGRFDRAWGPERPIFGKIRYMTSDSARRKFKVDAYIKRYSETAQTSLALE